VYNDVAPLRVVGGEIDMVTEFTYLGSCLCNDGEVTREVACRIAKASKAFGSLRDAISHCNLCQTACVLKISTHVATYTS